MARYEVGNIRNVVFCGHGSSGKTTLVDSLLALTGAVNSQPSVDNGTSICDFDEEEKHHKHSIEAAVTHFEHDGVRFNAIDTPGYPDLIGQAIGAMQAVETAVICIDAHAGIKVNTRRTFSEAGKAGLGRIICITKLDSDNIDFEGLLASIKEMFGTECVPLNVPHGVGAQFDGVISTLHVPSDVDDAPVDLAEYHELLVEHEVEADDEAMEAFLEGKEPDDEQLDALLEPSVKEGTLIPIVFVSAKTGVGLPEFLDLLKMAALTPDDVQRHGEKDGDTVTIEPKPDGPLVAQVFKTRVDPFVQKLSFLRILSGTLKKESSVPIDGNGGGKGIKLHQLFEVQGAQTEAIDAAGPGEIVAVTKMEDLHTGTSIGEVKVQPITFPTPMVGLAVRPKSRGDEAKLSGALHKIEEEDPTIHLDHDPETHELVMTGMSELHLQLVQEKLKRRDKVEVETHEPKIPYRETIQQEAEGSYRHKKQSGGSGQFGEVHIRMYPLAKDTDLEEYATKARFPQLKNTHYHEKHNFLWVDSVVGGSIPSNFLPAVEKGFLERIQRGVIAGYKVQNICVEVHYGKHHPVDSSEAAFKIAGSMAFREVFKKAKPGLLEPIVTMHITIPGEKLGDVNSDLSGRRGRVMGMDAIGGGLQTVTAEVPLAEVTTYARALSSMTGGQGSFTMEFSHYELVPGNVQKEIIDAAKVKDEEDEG